MNQTMGGLQIVDVPASGWCDPVTGVCSVDSADEVESTKPSGEGASTEEFDAGGLDSAAVGRADLGAAAPEIPAPT